ncbi:MAG: 30S ribosomal protein S6 [Bacteroidetes bacterium]|nr:30S ribosomal protein S6 [Bacteroidota bacterium]
MELRNYETVFIMTPVLSDSQVEETIDKFKKILEDFKAEIIFKSKWKLRKLVYPIQKKSTGIYQIIEFKAAPSIISDLEEQYRLDDTIIRFLTISLDKHGIEYNKNKHLKKEKEEVVEKETKHSANKAESEEKKKVKKVSKTEDSKEKSNEKEDSKGEVTQKVETKRENKKGTPQKV